VTAQSINPDGSPDGGKSLPAVITRIKSFPKILTYAIDSRQAERPLPSLWLDNGEETTPEKPHLSTVQIASRTPGLSSRRISPFGRRGEKANEFWGLSTTSLARESRCHLPNRLTFNNRASLGDLPASTNHAPENSHL
jgi:hypothetical protein